MRYSDDIIEEVRTRNDIVDGRAVLISASALFTMKNRPLVPSVRANRCIIALAAGREAMSIRF